MADIFLSYASEDRSKAEALAQCLEIQGWEVWWDRIIPAGQRYAKIIEESLSAAKSVIVLWSEISVTKDFVKDEAQEGMDHSILIPVLIEDAKIPIGFRQRQAADLIGWDGSASAAAFQRLVGDIISLVGEPPKKTEEMKQTNPPINLENRAKSAKNYTEFQPARARMDRAILDLLKNRVVDKVYAKDLDEITKLAFLKNTSDNTLAAFPPLINLTDLDLSDTKVTDAGLEHLKELAALQNLNLRNTDITDAGLEHLKSLTSLQVLDLRDTDITVAGLERLKSLTSLQKLNLGTYRVTNAVLEHLKVLTGLQKLDLSRSRVTNAGLEHLKVLTGLRELDLSSASEFTNAGIKHLKELTDLQELNLRRTKASKRAVKSLRDKMPGTIIDS